MEPRLKVTGCRSLQGGCGIRCQHWAGTSSRDSSARARESNRAGGCSTLTCPGQAQDHVGCYAGT